MRTLTAIVAFGIPVGCAAIFSECRGSPEVCPHSEKIVRRRGFLARAGFERL
jgi:hypothetical protein